MVVKEEVINVFSKLNVESKVELLDGITKLTPQHRQYILESIKILLHMQQAKKN